MYLGVLGASGTQIYRLTIATRAQTAPDRLSTETVVYALIGVFGVVLGFFTASAMLMGGWAGVTDPEVLGLLWDTSQGDLLRLCLAGLAVLMLASLIEGPTRIIGLIGAVVALSGFLVMGHVADADAGFASSAHFVHLIGMATWLGALIPLYRRARDGDNPAEIARAAERFGNLAMIFVPISLVAGVVIAWWLVGSAGMLLSTTYGLVLFGKIAIASGLLAVAAWNKLRLTPALRKGDARAAGALRRSIALELVVMLGIFVATSALTTVVAPS